jgi:hypothetical protein
MAGFKEHLESEVFAQRMLGHFGAAARNGGFVLTTREAFSPVISGNALVLETPTKIPQLPPPSLSEEVLGKIKESYEFSDDYMKFWHEAYSLGKIKAPVFSEVKPPNTPLRTRNRF